MGCCESKNLTYNIENDDKNSDIVITDIVAYGKSLENDKGVLDDINGNVTITTETVIVEDKNLKQDESEFTDVDLNDQDAANFDSAKLEISDLKGTEPPTEDETDAEKDTEEESTVSLPPPRPPQKLRKDLVPDVKVFARIDNIAEQVPQTEQKTVEALAKYLTDD
ncbi:uncharacterized protein LOC110449153 [Mizuhopecten yessoensis]|uniref:uncharacterized protein LOC110449153 n=1 Tax=Mizuhopecten yessoensis TaxID=6573 RepID=UPI000B45A6BD|nr:uncharacterized protein LOC110449153 [Mizuhopecten yessoensis]